MSLAMICPSRGRPEEAEALCRSLHETATQGDTYLMFSIDSDDPDKESYYEVVNKWDFAFTFVRSNKSMVEALNAAASFLTVHDAIGFVGDDHRFRTKGWDKLVCQPFLSNRAGVVYGRDGYQDEALPTWTVLSNNIVHKLGFMAPPVLNHLYVDDYWKMLGGCAGILHYLPDVMIEHMHPAAGKGEWTEGHLRVNNTESYSRDREAFNAYLLAGTQGFDGDLEKVNELL